MNDLSTRVFQETLNALIENLYTNTVSVWLVEDCLDLIAKTVAEPGWTGGRTATVSLADMQVLAAQEAPVTALNSPRATSLFNLIIGELEPQLIRLEFEHAVSVLANPSKASLQQLRDAQDVVVNAWHEDALVEASDEQLEIILNYEGSRATGYGDMLNELWPGPIGWETSSETPQLIPV